MVVDGGKERWQVGSLVNANHLSGAVEVTIRARFGPRTRARPPLPVLAAVLPRPRNTLVQGLLLSSFVLNILPSPSVRTSKAQPLTVDRRAEVPNRALRYLIGANFDLYSWYFRYENWR